MSRPDARRSGAERLLYRKQGAHGPGLGRAPLEQRRELREGLTGHLQDKRVVTEHAGRLERHWHEELWYCVRCSAVIFSAKAG